MPSYLITGTSGSIGFELLRQASSNPDNVVVGLVRSKAKMEERLAKELPNQKNVHIFEADLADYKSLAATVEPVSKVLGGSLDYLIANAAYMGQWAAVKPFEEQAKDPETLIAEYNKDFNINVLGNIHLFNLYLPLIRAGNTKKVIAISSGHADFDLVTKFHIHETAPYTIAKTALNMVIAKYHAAYADEGILFMSLCPGLVENDNSRAPPSEDMAKYGPALFAKFAAFAPHLSGATTPDGPAADILRISADASIEKGWGGSFTSHNGGKQWL
ncbi:uncharacterized protein B0I36DRAFT_261317 [Microdochium trichocladiopsis]|uniref:Short chain dehydrogenase n=1 Tax=Microdochium trichocladiopsis TaxID=1682393 RepID=A0A9P8YGY9_9PEZI|nr:uncharacterized protein B0I36DRAFT_261317 [Microdochium trichocladiopsis]KAH7041522.1 hypothetical protein B0I36DRAFT_261317 [Microdochium trichocladiopsis]